jgi:hypothetical protein
VDGLRRIVSAAPGGSTWTINLKPFIEILGGGRMRVGTEEFGFWQLESLGRIYEAKEWHGGDAVRLGFAVIR